MGSGKNIKFALCEVLQFAGLGVPIFVVMQRFASIMWRIRHAATPPGDANTAYWLIVASSVAYVTTVALLVWVPMKYMIFKKRKFLTVSTVLVLLLVLQVQISNRLQYDTFAELPVSLVLFSLIFMDIIERIRHCRLTGQGKEALFSFVIVQLAGQLPGQLAAQLAGQLGVNSASRSLPTYTLPRPLRFLCASDARADVFVDGFVFWFDTVEMVRAASHPGVYYSGWVFPIYIFSYLSVLRVIVMPGSPLLPTLGVALQDLPFLFVRIALIAIFGFVTPLLYLFKNLLVSLAFIYFNFMTKLRVFNTERMF
uniref:Transmembrane protein 236 n=1 Tax=Scleropages formosus TaxID=113540 RepID=A0A8C9QZW7_SCLFO